MNNRRSYLDAMNAGRRRRASTSLEQLSNTLDQLESRIGRTRDDRLAARPGSETSYLHGARGELDALRQELHQQMGSGLRHDFAALKDEIERAHHTSGPGQASELGVEFERLSAMIHKLAEQSDDRQVNLLRIEMEEVKGALGKLAREETVQSFDRRWDEFDRRWSDIASKVSAAHRDGDASGRALQALGTRLEQISDAVNTLPTSVALRSLEERMQMLSATVDQFAHQQDRIGPEALDAIEERLNEISRAVVASSAAARPAAFDPEPFERIEARISSLARQLGEITEENPGQIVLDQLSTLSHRVEDLAHRVDVPDHVVARLAEQIDLISRKLDQEPAAPDLGRLFDGLENRFATLSAMLEQRHEDALTQGQSLFRDLERRLEDVAARDQQAATPADEFALRDLEARLDSICERIDQSARPGVDPDLIRSLETQIAGLAAHLSQPTAVPEAASIPPRLDRIEQSILDSRQDVLEAARHAAEEAVRGFTGSAGESALVAGLADDLKSLEALTRKSDDRNTRTFEAIHDTLLKIVDRLSGLESVRAAPARDTLAQVPSLDLAETMPLAEDDSPEPSVPNAVRPRSPAAAAAEAAADAAREETGATGKRSMLGGLTRALSRKSKSSEPEAETPAAEMPAAAQLETAAPTVEVDPPLDPKIANRPLEPGSGAPDLNAIMKRVRDERGQPPRGAEGEVAKSDFIAAARRAAQAAAAEAEVMKRGPVDKGKSGGLGRLFGVRRKPVLMGVAAVLMALAALQGGRALLGGGDATDQPVAVAEEATQQETDPATSIIALAEPQDEAVVAAEEAAAPAVEAEEPDVAPEAPPVTARDVMASVPETADEVTTDWLDPTATTAAATATPQTGEPAEIEAVPEPDETALAAIPVTAGPIALREAAAAGDPKALFEIGNRYAEGRGGVAEDMAQAAGWYEKAADQGLAPAQYRIGNLYEKGVGTARDLAKAKTWYQLAAAQGNASAMHNLAVLFAMGADGVTDNESAARWFTQAAEFGVTDSQYNLGILTAKGVGMQQDLEAAYKWFALVAKAGDKDAAEKRDEVAGTLSPEQLDRARAATELWRAKPVEAEANVVEIPESWSESADTTTATVDLRQAVRNIQQILNKNGYDAGSADGLLGSRTQNAIAAFQKDNGMEPTGEVDETLVRTLLAKR